MAGSCSCRRSPFIDHLSDVAAALANIDPALDEAARISVRGAWTRFGASLCRW
jgi:ABC-type Fe3+ transport system permease subunit